jgi:hypothetical protein
MHIILCLSLVLLVAACSKHTTIKHPEHFCVHQQFDISDYMYVGLPDVHWACREQTGNPYMQARLMPDGTVFDWTCMPNPQKIRVDMDEACRTQYRNDKLVACYTNFNNPISWQCMHPRERR